MLAILRKELKTYFLTPVGWIFLAVFLLISGILFATQLIFRQSSQYAAFLSSLLFIFLLVVPLLTMRIFTDEKRFRTDQLLLTGPTSLSGIVLGKYFAALAVFLITVLITLIYPLVLSFHGRLEWAVIVGTYAGFILVGAAFIAIGVFISGASEGVVGAAVLTFCALIITFIIDFLRPNMPSNETAGLVWVIILAALPMFRLYTAGKNWRITGAAVLIAAALLVLLWFVRRDVYSGLIAKSLGWLSLTRRFGSFAVGILKLDSIVYYLSFSVFFLFLSVQTLEKRRWN